MDDSEKMPETSTDFQRFPVDGLRRERQCWGRLEHMRNSSFNPAEACCMGLLMNTHLTKDAVSARADAQAQPYFDGLNEPQLKAVQTVDGPVLVLAGAGSGKTRALTARMAHILHTKRAWPSEILAVTFTNKAANEMRERVGAYLHLGARILPWLGTFHSIGAKILRSKAELVGLKPDFTILDADDQLRLHKQLISEANIDPKQWPPRQLQAIIDRWKNQGWLPDDVPKSEWDSFNRKGHKLYKQYQERLERLNAADFGDLILQVVELLRRNDSVLAEYQRRFKYILVDEYQDTNVAQYLMLSLLAQAHGNICCVGDDDQSIYGWRGAEVRNILEFQKNFNGAQIIRLEQNYRSTGHILAAASGVIAHNGSRLGKTLWTEAGPGEKIQLAEVWDGNAEAEWIGTQIEDLNGGGESRREYGFDEIAILVRMSRQMLAIEDRLIASGVPYRVIGGPRFYERREIRDAIAYFRLAVSKSDDLAFERIVNTPKRGMGPKSVGAIHAESRSKGISLLEGAWSLLQKGKLPRPAKDSMAKLLRRLDEWSELVRENQQNHAAAADKIIKQSGLLEMWANTKTPDAEARIDNLNELAGKINEFESIQAFLEHIALVAESGEDADAKKVTLMTLHAAKGLEFPVVFLPGWEDGGFPSQRALDEQLERGLEEERRLAYVGITRAKEVCVVTCAATRFVNGEWRSGIRSRFIGEIPEKNLQTLTPPGAGWQRYSYGERDRDISRLSQSAADTQGGYSSPGFQRMARRISSGDVGSARRPKAKAKVASPFAAGDRVFHRKFGPGEVVEVNDVKVDVEFDHAGTKHVLANYLTKGDGSQG